jgi:hypothetical protein
MATIKARGLQFSIWVDPGELSSDEKLMFLQDVKALLGFVEPEPLELRERRAIRNALLDYEGRLYHRAQELEHDYSRYVATGWKLERDLADLPAPTSERRKACHAIARLRDGAPLGWHQIWRHGATIFATGKPFR